MVLSFIFSRESRVLLTMALLFLAGGCASVAPQARVEFEQAEWSSQTGVSGVQMLTAHYDLRVSARDEILRQYMPEFMETALVEYRKVMPPAREPSDRMVIYVFNDRPEWVQFTRGFAPNQAHVYMHIHTGGYMDHARATAVLWDIGRENTLALIAHEGWHQYLAKCFPEPVPAWLNEGLATQWEGFDLAGERPVFNSAGNYMRRGNLRDALAAGGQDGLIPLPELLAMDAGYAVVKTGATVRNYYTQVWSLVLFLQEGQNTEYTQGFRNLLADAGTARMQAAVRAYRAATPGAEQYSTGEVVFRHYITEDLDTFTAAYRQYAINLVF